jgi:uncharacterized integral membrane protein
MSKFNIVVMVAFLVLLTILMIQNAQIFTFRFLVWMVRIPQLAAIILLVGIGFTAGFVTAKATKFRLKK